jgi:uncharacterized membrane protein YfcA
MLIPDPWFYLAAVVAVMLTGISKGGFGGAAGGTAVPIMALVISPVQAAAVMLPILCVMDIAGIAAYRRIWDKRNLVIMLPAAVTGIVIGALTFRYLSDDAVRLIIGSIALSFASYNVLKRVILRTAVGEPAQRNVLRGGLAGVAAGFTSFVAHAGSPPVQIYLLPQRLDKTLYVGTTVIFFFVVNYVKLIPYAIIGQFSSENLLTSLVLLPLGPFGVWVGVKLHKVVPEALFYRISYALLFVTGAKLIYDGLGL